MIQELFAQPDNREFFVSVGRDLISRLLLNAQKVSFRNLALRYRRYVVRAIHNYCYFNIT